MTADQYRDFLDSFAAEGFSSLSLHPVQSAQIFDVENQLGSNLPEQYETFLTMVGTGDENGGVGRWYHFDIMSPGNVLEESARMPENSPAAGMLVFYDACDGDLYGFLPGKARFMPEVYAWNIESDEMRRVADSFEEFLDCLARDDIEM